MELGLIRDLRRGGMKGRVIKLLWWAISAQLEDMWRGDCPTKGLARRAWKAPTLMNQIAAPDY